MSNGINRSSHPDFKKVEASRPGWNKTTFHYTQVPEPSWKFGDGSNTLDRASPEPASKNHIAIDPYEPGRQSSLNYKLLISAITPRPIALISSLSADGKTTNLAPFSFFNTVHHDPPIFVVGFSSSLANAKDTLRNIVDSKECVINIISEHFIEAANSTSVNAPFGTSEWDISGLTPVFSSKTVKAPRVKEAVFSIEVKLDHLKEYESRVTGRTTGTVATFEGTHFWVREDALDENKDIVDPKVLRSIGRLGGISYARVTEGFELPRPKFEEDVGGQAGFDKIKRSKQ